MPFPEFISGRGGAVNRSHPLAHGSMLDLEFTHLSEVGRVRHHNEDYVGHYCPTSPAQVRSHGWLFALADGVGGQQKGEVASRTAVEKLLGDFAASSPPEHQGTLLAKLVKAANTEVVQTALASGPSAAGMATTLVACAVRYDRATVAHVGDSRCYLIRSGKARVITNDHTVANEQIKLGVLSKDEAAAASTKHVLSRSLGADLFVNVEINEVSVLPADILLLCCDGLHGAIDDAHMARIVTQQADLNAGARELVDTANRQDGSDNISVQLIRIRSIERMGMYRGRPYKLR